MSSRPFLLLPWVLIGHAVGLFWLHQQAQDLKPLISMPEPMLTRIIEPQRSALPAHPLKSRRPQASMPASEAAALTSEAQTRPASAPAQASPELHSELAQADAAVPPRLESEQLELEAPAVESEPQALAAAVPTPDSWPGDTRLSYQLRGYYRGELHGSARVQWQREQSRYQVRVDLSMALVLRVSMISQGQIGAAGLVPQAYEEQFPWDLRRLAFEGGYIKFRDGTQLPAPPDLQDTASQFVELSHRFSSGREELKVGALVNIWLARPQGLALWTYDVIEVETLQLPELGPVQAFHLRPRPIANPTGAITAEIWFAPTLQYLPVRVRIALGDNNFVDLMVERVEQGAGPLEPPLDQPLNP